MGRLDLSALQKITAVFGMLAYGQPTDATDEYIKIGESTTIESLNRFCRVAVEVFAQQYLRSPNVDDVARLLRIGKHCVFSGMLVTGNRKNVQRLGPGQYAGHSGSPTIILEIVADYDLWIYHVFFGLPGSNNYINVLEASRLFANLIEGPISFWKNHELHDIMIACIIMHNMIIENERDVDVAIEDHMEAPTSQVKRVLDENTRFQEFLA
ncbi:hypothetical protein Ddye_013426 [Dipteronia dyeriana]|uniref:DDE Tnp4 domain-containing protein n=1 Tax=Dipteronia dyeriana TaxID=168575 RepID=A0AAD9X6B3_9ROSI|nr:hypothetical protein Ddye_013426 [Dipteronia dyeriana]